MWAQGNVPRRLLHHGPARGMDGFMTEKTDRERPRRTPPGRSSCRDWLISHRERLQRDQVRYRRLEARWSWTRLVAFVAGLCMVVLLRHEVLLAAPAAVVGLGIFLGTILRHTRWEAKRAFVDRALVVVEESLEASTSRDHPVRAWARPADPADTSVSLPPIVASGPTWSLTDQERDDLDLYGAPLGLFGLLNRTSTDLGARRLRDMLDAPCLSAEHIQGRQQAIRWLCAHGEQRIGMMASAVLLRGRSARLDELVGLLYRTEPHRHRVASRCVRVWSALSGLLVLCAVSQGLNGHYGWFRLLVIVLVVNGLIMRACKRMLSTLRGSVAPWTTMRSALRCLLAVAERAGQELPDETQLGPLRVCFRRVVRQAPVASLCEWLEWASLHGMVRGLLNAVVFLDVHVGEAVLARIIPNRDILLRGLSALAELEALNSLACFSAEQPVACYPQTVPDPGLSIERGRHPLIPHADVTPNSVDVTCDQRTWVITGPNAAGKSTFLRMVGVNVLLAQIGAAVPARAMTWSPVRLMTDVRIRDDLAKHESYFLSEVRRLRRMVLDPPNDARLLGLIDEPFRGTNSAERIAAGVALLEHLLVSRNLFIVATHEETLARTAAADPSAENYHFQERLDEGGVTFDYRLRPGPASTRTALRILEQEGYPAALLERARRLMAP